MRLLLATMFISAIFLNAAPAMAEAICVTNYGIATPQVVSRGFDAISIQGESRSGMHNGRYVRYTLSIAAANHSAIRDFTTIMSEYGAPVTPGQYAFSKKAPVVNIFLDPKSTFGLGLTNGGSGFLGKIATLDDANDVCILAPHHTAQ